MHVLALILTAIAASASLAQEPPPAAVRTAAPHNGLDPNETICRRELAVGSRLHGIRRCLTRAQWIEGSRLDRQYAEKAQTTRTYCGGICARRMGHGR